MFVRNRQSSRGLFFDVWRKYNVNAQLEPLEQLVLGVILEHPEYHHFLHDDANTMELEFDPGSGKTNPFLHMGMHIAVKEDRKNRCRRIGLPGSEKYFYHYVKPVRSNTKLNMK